MPLDQDGKPYVEKCDSRNNKIRVTPEKDGWSKELVLTYCIGKVPVYLPNKRQPSIITKKEAYVIRKYKIKPKSCQYCRDQKENYDYIKLMTPKSGLYWKCFRGIYGAFGNSDTVQQYNDYDNPKLKNFELLEETIVDTKKRSWSYT